MAEKEESKGLVVIGVTDEEVGLVDKWVAENQPDYPIVVLEDGSLEDALGVEYFPTAAIVNTAGQIVYSGSAQGYDKVLEEAMADAEKGSVVPKVFKKFMKELKDGETCKAYDVVVGLVESEKLEGAELGWGRKLKTWLEGEATSALAKAKTEREEGWIYNAYKRVSFYLDSKAGFPNRSEIAAFIAEMEAADSFKDEMKAGEMFDDVRATLDEQEFAKAVAELRKIYAKYDQTRIAEHARRVAQEIVDKGLPGYESHCDNCRRKQQACSKHAEEVKL